MGALNSLNPVVAGQAATFTNALWRRRALLWPILGGLSAPLAWLNLRGVVSTAPAASDFAGYWGGARIGLEAGWSQLYNAGAEARIWTEFGILQPWPLAQAPTVVWLVLPLAALSLPLAYGVFASLMGLSLAAVWWMQASGDARAKLSQLLIFSALPGVGLAIKLGNVLCLVAVACVGAAWLLRRGHPIWAGIALAGISFKPQLALLLPVCLYLAGYRQTFWVFAGVAALQAATALLLLQPSGLEAGLARVQLVAEQPASFAGDTVTWPGLLGVGVGARLLEVLCAALGLWAAWRHRGNIESAVAAGILGSLLASPFLHEQDVVVMLAVAAWSWVRAGGSWAWPALLLVAVWIPHVPGTAFLGWAPTLGVGLGGLLWLIYQGGFGMVGAQARQRSLSQN